MKALQNTHDLRLPAWGPYTKAYMGISHIPDPAMGLRFDLSVFPGYYRGDIQVPNVKWVSGYHPWEATPDLTYYCHRHQLEWKDQVYVDIAFAQTASGMDARLIQCECVNNTPLPQTLVLHYIASVYFPPLRTNDDRAIHPANVSLPQGALWVDALAYAELTYATPRPTDCLMPDGLRRGEARGDGYVGGAGLGRGFGAEHGDRVRYTMQLSHALRQGVILLRCRLAPGRQARIQCTGLSSDVVTVAGTDGFQLVRVPLQRNVPAGTHQLELTSLDTQPLDLDGLVVCEAQQEGSVSFDEVNWDATPTIVPGPTQNSIVLRYPQFTVEYGLAWQGNVTSQLREFRCDALDLVMRRTVHNHTRSVLEDTWAATPPNGHYTDLFIRPLALEPHATRRLHAVVCCGDGDSVRRLLETVPLTDEACDPVVAHARSRVVDLGGSPDGACYRFSQDRMAATTLTNVVYPVHVRGTYIRHNTPGRWWDSLYTWDSGFIGLGLAELDTARAVDCLNAYLTEPGDPHAAFIHHGSPVPVQFYLFLELWNRTQDHALLAHCYPRLHQYYLFLSGKLEGSTTRSLPSNLLKTWDYFYNSGGWDDYPAQVHVHRWGLTASVTPAVTTAHCIRAAKILRMAALESGHGHDVAQYDDDIRTFASALQEHAWDGEAGYFSYVVHDGAGRPVAPLRHDSGANYNRGLDGVSPLIAGVCTPEQELALLRHLQSPERHWTPIGLSTVDRSAPYYREDGYWNGAVWMPHQWFVWKTCLDLGQGEFGWEIARTGLDVWQREVAASYNCCEHFFVATGRGAGWHHFGGLSTPVLTWYGSYFRPGRLTTGFDAWVSGLDVSEDRRALTADLRTYGRRGCEQSLVVCLEPGCAYEASWNGERCSTYVLHSGTNLVRVPCDAEGTLAVRPA